MTISTRIDLAVPFSRKEEAKALGARWDASVRTWYAPPGTDLQGFDRRWLPTGCEMDAETGPSSTPPESNSEPEKGISLTDLLNRVKGVINAGLPDAVWVRAEISELRGKNGHLYPSLTERGGPLDISKINSEWKADNPGASQPRRLRPLASESGIVRIQCVRESRANSPV